MDELVRQLRALHTKAGAPSTRNIARRSGVSHTTVAEYLHGERARLETLLRIVAALDGDVSEFTKLYVRNAEPSERRSPLAPNQREILLAILEELRALRSELRSDRLAPP